MLPYLLSFHDYSVSFSFFYLCISGKQPTAIYDVDITTPPICLAIVSVSGCMINVLVELDCLNFVASVMIIRLLTQKMSFFRKRFAEPSYRI